MARFEIFRDSAGQIRFRLRAPNGEILAASEGYVSNASARIGVEAVRRHASAADVIDLT